MSVMNSKILLFMLLQEDRNRIYLLLYSTFLKSAKVHQSGEKIYAIHKEVRQSITMFLHFCFNKLITVQLNKDYHVLALAFNKRTRSEQSLSL